MFLKPIGFVGAIDLRPLTRQQRIPPDYILELDAATEEAMQGNDLKPSTACIPADLWFPLLPIAPERATCVRRAPVHMITSSVTYGADATVRVRPKGCRSRRCPPTTRDVSWR